MKQAGERLNLKGHRVGHSTQLIYGPGDIECHLGKVCFSIDRIKKWIDKFKTQLKYY
jgi:hypothetical protein